jgi:hypothetical protein
VSSAVDEATEITDSSESGAAVTSSSVLSAGSFAPPATTGTVNFTGNVNGVAAAAAAVGASADPTDGKIADASSVLPEHGPVLTSVGATNLADETGAATCPDTVVATG